MQNSSQIGKKNFFVIFSSLFNDFMNVCRDLSTSKSTDLKAFFLLKNHSSLISSLKKLIVEAIDTNQDKGASLLLPKYLKALEVALISEDNRLKAVDIKLYIVLGKYIQNSPIEESITQTCLKCLLDLSSIELMPTKMLAKASFARWLSLIFQNSNNSEHLSSMIQIFQLVRVVFKDSNAIEIILNNNQGLPCDLFEYLAITKTANTEVLEAHLNVKNIFKIFNFQAIKAFSKSINHLELVDPANQIEAIIDILNDSKIPRIKNISIEILKNFSKKSQFMKLIQKANLVQTVQSY